MFSHLKLVNEIKHEFKRRRLSLPRCMTSFRESKKDYSAQSYPKSPILLGNSRDTEPLDEEVRVPSEGFSASLDGLQKL